MNIAMTELDRMEGGIAACEGVKIRDLYAWNDLMPPRPHFFRLTAEALVRNPGIDPVLTPAVPQGVNPAVLVLDLALRQQSGAWPRVFVWKPLRYDRRIVRGYTHVSIRCGGDEIASVEVEDIR